MPDSTDRIGARIYDLRLIRDLSLSELGRRAHVSASQLSRIETGHRPASESVLAAVARALGVSVSVLRGQPYIQTLHKEQLDALLQPISTAFDDWDLPPDDAPPPRPLDVLESDVRRIRELRVDAKFTEIAGELPGLISELALATQLPGSGRDRERAYAAQAEVSRTAAIVAYRIGYMDLARLSLARMAIAAPLSGDPRQVAVERYERAQMAADSSRLDRGVSLMRHALRDLDDDGEQQTRAVRGTLQLRAATLSARRGDAAGAGDWIGEAGELAERTGETRDYALAFGPLNVQLHRLAAAGDQDDYDTALSVATDVTLPVDYPPTRAAHSTHGSRPHRPLSRRVGPRPLPLLGNRPTPRHRHLLRSKLSPMGRHRPQRPPGLEEEHGPARPRLGDLLALLHPVGSARHWGETSNDPAVLGARVCADLLRQGARTIIEGIPH